MTNSTLTKAQPNLFSPPKEIGIPAFLHHAPSGYAIYDLDLRKIIYHNQALLQTLHCEAFALKDVFPNPKVLRIQDLNFLSNWQSQLQRMNRTEKAQLECTLRSVYGGRMVLKWELWRMADADRRLCGIKVEDITAWKKMKLESINHVKII